MPMGTPVHRATPGQLKAARHSVVVAQETRATRRGVVVIGGRGHGATTAAVQGRAPAPP